MTVGVTGEAMRSIARGTILAVDDEPDILVALEDLFEDEYRVLTTSRPAEALELIAAVAPRRALLTHLDHDLDFEELAARLPAGVAPAFDGLVVEVAAR